MQDENRLKQILINIISNGIKFTSEGSIEIGAESFFMEGIERIVPLLKITIKDSGIGMTEEGVKNLFNLFGKLNENAHLNKQGTGLGLFISKQLCQSMGGDIQVKSRINEGSIFEIYIEPKAINDIHKH